jgi:hypothetical protein
MRGRPTGDQAWVERDRAGAEVIRHRRAIGIRAGVAVALALGFAVAACSSPSGSLSTTPGANATSSLVPAEEGSPESSDTAGSSQPAAGLTSPVQGLLLHVDLAGLGKVTGFRLLTADGRQIDFKLGVQENAAEFPAAHLSEHMAGGDPVLVYFRQSGSDLVVYRLEDASPASGSPQVSASPASGSPSAS